MDILSFRTPQVGSKPRLVHRRNQQLVTFHHHIHALAGAKSAIALLRPRYSQSFIPFTSSSEVHRDLLVGCFLSIGFTIKHMID